MGEPLRWQEAPPGHEALRIHDPRQAAGADYDGLSCEMRLSEFVAAYYKPVHLITRDARPRNIEEVDQTVKYWVELTGDPPLAAINVYHCRDFVVGLKRLPGRKYATMGNNTVRKHCGAIQAILDLCGPPSRDNREGVGLLETVPYLARPPKAETKCEDTFTREELLRLVDAADAARLPDKLPCTAGTYLRRLYVFDFNTGLRPTGFMLAAWKHFHGTHLILPARTVAKGHRDLRVELNDTARQIIESMDGFHPERIFPWPAQWPASRGQLYRQHDRVRQCLPKNRRFAWYGIRRLHNNELAQINPLACQKALGHTTGRTTVEHYTSRTLVAAAVAKLPKLHVSVERQRRLFD